MNNNTVVTLKKGEGRTIKNGGLWIYDNEIASISGTFKNGEVVSVQDFDGYPMGKGFINQNSKIRIRMLTRDSKQEINDDFIKMRVANAWNYRKTVMSGGNSGENNDLNCCRVIFGEADFLPGIVIDKYNDVLVVECLALGMEAFKKKIVEFLIECMVNDDISIHLAYERSDARERDKEGLPRVKGVIWTDETVSPEEPVEIVENNVHYLVDVVNGQKTGFFLDQKYNRLAMQQLCKNISDRFSNTTNNNRSLEFETKIRVLDCFTHMGTFALNCGLGLKGANAEVTGLDISEYAVSQAENNAKLNGLSDIVKFRCTNVLDELPKLSEAGEKYDVLILDPPAFTKSREATKNAIKGYREINMKGLKLVKDGGYFATCSCSHFMTQELFTKTIKEAAKAVHKRLRQIEFRTQSKDHPILWAGMSDAPESYYLKFLIFQVVDETR